jgi:hypothetical protein
LRAIETIDGKVIIERLTATDPSARSYTYANVSGLAVADYTGSLDVKAKGTGSVVEWRAQFLANDQPTIIVRAIVSALLKTGVT